MSKKIRLPQYAWFKPREVEYTLPETWDITEHNIAGYDKKPIGNADIKKAITAPLGMPPLRESAKGRKEVVILFDDMTRCTRTSEVLPFILSELALAGITDNQIRFIAAVANHQALSRIEMVKKLGKEVVSRFPVYNHCPFLNCREIGKTGFGTKIEINSEVLHCDLKIAIGQVVPHPIYGLSGGSKMIMPGVSSYQSILDHHGPSHQLWRQQRMISGVLGSDVIDGNPFRDDAMEIAKLAGLDMIVNTLIDRLGRSVAIFAGALQPVYTNATAAAKEHYSVDNTADNDIVILNNFVKASEFVIPLSSGARALKKNGGTIVVVDHSPGGQVIHYLVDDFGTTITGDLFKPITLAENVNKVIIFNKYPEGRLLRRFENPERVVFLTKWPEVVALLKQAHGKKAKVAVYPNSDTQILV
jgi:nickel-dependent lactate racemase